MSKLWTVRVTIETEAYAVVYAETEHEAESISRNNSRDITDLAYADTYADADELLDDVALPEGWRGQDTPYGADRTIEHLRELALIEPTPRELDTKTIDMFEGQPA